MGFVRGLAVGGGLANASSKLRLQREQMELGADSFDRQLGLARDKHDLDALNDGVSRRVLGNTDVRQEAVFARDQALQQITAFGHVLSAGINSGRDAAWQATQFNALPDGARDLLTGVGAGILSKGARTNSTTDSGVVMTQAAAVDPNRLTITDGTGVNAVTAATNSKDTAANNSGKALTFSGNQMLDVIAAITRDPQLLAAMTSRSDDKLIASLVVPDTATATDTAAATGTASAPGTTTASAPATGQATDTASAQDTAPPPTPAQDTAPPPKLTVNERIKEAQFSDQLSTAIGNTTDILAEGLAQVPSDYGISRPLSGYYGRASTTNHHTDRINKAISKKIDATMLLGALNVDKGLAAVNTLRAEIEKQIEVDVTSNINASIKKPRARSLTALADMYNRSLERLDSIEQDIRTKKNTRDMLRKNQLGAGPVGTDSDSNSNRGSGARKTVSSSRLGQTHTQTQTQTLSIPTTTTDSSKEKNLAAKAVYKRNAKTYRRLFPNMSAGSLAAVLRGESPDSLNRAVVEGNLARAKAERAAAGAEANEKKAKNDAAREVARKAGVKNLVTSLRDSLGANNKTSGVGREFQAKFYASGILDQPNTTEKTVGVLYDAFKKLYGIAKSSDTFSGANITISAAMVYNALEGFPEMGHLAGGEEKMAATAYAVGNLQQQYRQYVKKAVGLYKQPINFFDFQSYVLQDIEGLTGVNRKAAWQELITAPKPSPRR